MVLPIYLYGHPVLRKEAEDVPADYENLQQLVADMFATMDHSDGVGLAAPQVGLSLNMFVIDGTPVADRFPECADSRICMINPEVEVIEDCDAVTREEGCLSLPGLSESVKRIEHINVKWLDEKMQPHEREFRGFISRIIQHENDHLFGEVYIDHISTVRKQLLRNKLNNIVKGKVSCDYRVKTAPKKHG